MLAGVPVSYWRAVPSGACGRRSGFKTCCASFPDIEKPGAHRREHPLVAVGGVEIAAHVMQIHRELPDGLAAVPEG